MMLEPRITFSFDPELPSPTPWLYYLNIERNTELKNWLKPSVKHKITKPPTSICVITQTKEIFSLILLVFSWSLWVSFILSLKQHYGQFHQTCTRWLKINLQHVFGYNINTILCFLFFYYSFILSFYYILIALNEIKMKFNSLWRSPGS